MKRTLYASFREFADDFRRYTRRFVIAGGANPRVSRDSFFAGGAKARVSRRFVSAGEPEARV